jgi:hypothetical protein
LVRASTRATERYHVVQVAARAARAAERVYMRRG